MAGRRALASAVTAASRVKAAAGRAGAGGASAARSATTTTPAARSSAAAAAALPELAHNPADAFPPPRPIITAITTNAFGAVSPAEEGSAASSAAPAVFRNEDGARVDDGRYGRFLASVTATAGIPADRIFQDPLRTFAYATDASFYRLVPKAVIKVSRGLERVPPREEKGRAAEREGERAPRLRPALPSLPATHHPSAHARVGPKAPGVRGPRLGRVCGRPARTRGRPKAPAPPREFLARPTLSPGAAPRAHPYPSTSLPPTPRSRPRRRSPRSCHWPRRTACRSRSGRRGQACLGRCVVLVLGGGSVHAVARLPAFVGSGRGGGCGRGRHDCQGLARPLADHLRAVWWWGGRARAPFLRARRTRRGLRARPEKKNTPPPEKKHPPFLTPFFFPPLNKGHHRLRPAQALPHRHRLPPPHRPRRRLPHHGRARPDRRGGERDPGPPQGRRRAPGPVQDRS